MARRSPRRWPPMSRVANYRPKNQKRWRKSKKGNPKQRQADSRVAEPMRKLTTMTRTTNQNSRGHVENQCGRLDTGNRIRTRTLSRLFLPTPITCPRSMLRVRSRTTPICSVYSCAPIPNLAARPPPHLSLLFLSRLSLLCPRLLPHLVFLGCLRCAPCLRCHLMEA